nr:histidine phosphatase family protein [Ameyamaea chiangmaiensis]
MRHATARDARPGEQDADRPLTLGGVEQARAVGAWIARQHILPTLVLCSPARRTRETLAGLDLPSSVPVAFPPALYNAHDDALARELAAREDVMGPVLLIGHNPSIHSFALGLALRSADALAAEAAVRAYPPATLAVFSIPGDWSDIERSKAQLLAVF